MIGFVCGRVGSGKSVLGDQIAHNYFARTGHVVVLDTIQERDSLVEVAATECGEFLADHPTDHRYFRVLSRDSEVFDQLSKSLRRRPDKSVPVLLMVDELSWWAKSNWICAGLADLVRYGRHGAVDLLGLTRRAAEIARDFTANAQRFWIFRTHEPNDIRYWSSVLPTAAVQRIQTLNRFEFVRYFIDKEEWKVGGGIDKHRGAN
jgi:hypothetical protein